MVKRRTEVVDGTEFVIFGADENSFMITSTLIIKDTQAVLVGTSFTKENAQEMVDFIQEKNVALMSVYLLHGDPDYYFGLETVKKTFPSVIAYSTRETFEQIVGTVENKLNVWQDTLGDDLPQNIVLPKINPTTSIDLLNDSWQVVGDDLSRTSLWNPKLGVLLGGIDTFNEVHLFLADTSSKEKLTAWSKRVEHLINLNPTVVIPSHGSLNKSFNVTCLQYTKKYLEKALEVVDIAKNSETFMQQMKEAFPGLENQGVLELSAKVLKKEVPWG